MRGPQARMAGRKPGRTIANAPSSLFVREGRELFQGAAMTLAGLVTAGGLATRMGGEPLTVDKALLRPWGAAGPSLLERAHGELARLASPVWVACRAGRSYAEYACVTDAFPDCGPMGGIEAGLAAAAAKGRTALLVLACDMPFMTAPLLRRLMAAREAWTARHGGAPLMTAFTQRGSRYFQTLSAVYDVAALPLLRDCLRAGRLGLYAATPPERRCLVEYGEEEAVFFFNVNTPEDAAAAGRMGRVAPEGLTLSDP